MFSDNEQPHWSSAENPESSPRVGMMLTDLWHDWFEVMSQVAYQTHRACELLAESGGPSNAQHSPFGFPPHTPSEATNEPIDMDQLKRCLQSMDSMQAARVMHAVQVMQAMEAMLKKRRSRANDAEGAAW